MSWVDVALAAIILLGAVAGWRRGFIRASLFLLALAAALTAAFLGYRWVANQLLAAMPDAGVWAQPASFLLVFVATQLLLDMLAVRLIWRVPPKVHANRLNSLLGLAPGAVNGTIHAAIVSLLLTVLPTFEPVSESMRESELAPALAESAEWVEAKLLPIFDPAVRRTLQALTVPVDSHQSVKLPFKVANAMPRPDLEARMLEMVNAERAKHGLKPLKADPQARDVARAHSRDMFARGYFSHDNPEGASAGDRLRKQEVRFLLAGENLALAHSLAVAHRGLMNSPGHRANILRPQFGRVGIGVLDGGARGLMITQNFRN